VREESVRVEKEERGRDWKESRREKRRREEEI